MKGENPAGKSSKKSGRRILIILGSIIALICIGLLALVLFLDINSFREPLISQISKATGLKVEIKSLDLSVFPHLGVKAEGLEVRSADGSQKLFSAASLTVNTELGPLLNKQLKIKKFIIMEPVVNIYLDQLGKQPPTLSGDSETQPLPPQQSPMDAIKLFLIRSDFSLNNLEVRQGRIIIFPKSSGTRAGKQLVVNVSSRLQVQRQGDQRIDVVLGPAKFGLGNLTAKATIRGNDVLSPQGSVRIDFVSGAFSLADLKPLQGFLPAALNDLLKEKKVSAKVEMISLNLDSRIAHLQDPAALQQNANVSFEFQIKDVSLNIAGTDIAVSRMGGEGTLKGGNLAYRLQANLLDGEVLLNGNFQPTGKNFAVNFSGKELRVEDVAKERASGRLKLDGNLHGHLRDEIPGRSVSGKANIALTQGNLQVSGAVKTILDMLNLSLREQEKSGLPYKYIGGDVQIQNGVATTDNFKMQSALLDLDVKAQANLLTHQIKGEAKTTLNVSLLGEPLDGGGEWKLISKLRGPWRTQK